MCGRYASSASRDQLVEEFEVEEVMDTPDLPELRPRWNIAPTDPVAAVLERIDKRSGETVRKLGALRWGLVPSWSKDAKGAARLINARSETVAEKPAFRKAFAQRRCLIPADGYYEWYPATDPATGKPVKQPFYIHPTAGHGLDLMTMAGIYEFWRNERVASDAPDAWLTTCSIITTTASDALGQIHDRMPVQVRPEDWAAWLDPHLTDPLAAHDLLHAPESDEMTAYAVSRAVSNVRNDGPELIEPMEESR